MKKQKLPNQLFRDLLGVCGLNSWAGHDSSSRVQMFSSHIGQTLVVKGATERRCQSGMEREFGKYTFSVKMPVDAEIIKVIHRYPATAGIDSIAMNPQSIIIYEDIETKEVGMVDLRTYCSYHQYFGFEYASKPAIHEVRQGAHIKGGTVLLDSPSVTPSGGYKYGVEANIAFMSHPAVSEDGILISEDFLTKFGFKTYEQRVVEWGTKRFPLNLYGDKDNYKPFPDIGDRIRDDGLLMCLRSYNTELAVVEQSARDLTEPDFIFDKCTYAAGAGGRIVDIRIHHDARAPIAPTAYGETPAPSMDTQPLKYDQARRRFYHEITQVYFALKRNRGENLRLTPEFHRMVVEALAVTDPVNDSQRIVMLYRQAPLDTWRVEFIVEYDIVPTIGFKLTDCHGGKGVICHIAKPEEMPIDENGNRADIVMDGGATVNRMNPGRLYEQYINASSRDTTNKIRQDLGFKATDHGLELQLTELERTDPQRINHAWNYLMGFYSIVSPRVFAWFIGDEYQGTRASHLAAVVKDGIYNYLPTENDPESVDIIMELEKHYRPTYGPVTYVGNSGERVTTKDPVRIGSVYMILLEKIGDDWTAVSSGKLQHYGVLSQVTSTDKYATPSRNQAIRAWGESEVRIGVSFVGTSFVAEIMDRNNNPQTHKQILQSILAADKPTNIYSVVDRSTIPLGGARPLQLVKHIGECGGWKFIYEPHRSNYRVPVAQV